MNEFLYSYLVALSVVAFVIMRRGFTGPRSWFAIIFLLNSSSYLLAYPMAIAGFSTHEWLVGYPTLTLYLTIVAVWATSSWIACELCVRRFRLIGFLRDVPEIVISERMVIGIVYVVTIIGVIGSILMSAWGYQGYFIDDRFLTDPPAWLDLARHGLSLSCALLFFICVTEFRRYGRLTPAAWLVTILWFATGFLTALKTLVVLPFLLLFVAAWLTGRMRIAHMALLAFAIWCAYSVVQPMRLEKNQGTSNNAVEAFVQVISAPGNGLAGVDGVVGAFLNRMDYSKEAVRALDADDRGLLDVYEDRLAETYRLVLWLAFVPRAAWPEKPLADLGLELSIALDNNDENSITPSGPIASYLWAGYFGVVINAFMGSFFMIVAGQILMRYSTRPIAYLPVVMLALAFSLQAGIMAHFYISVLRFSLMAVMFYAAAVMLGICRRHKLIHASNANSRA